MKIYYVSKGRLCGALGEFDFPETMTNQNLLLYNVHAWFIVHYTTICLLIVYILVYLQVSRLTFVPLPIIV